MTEELICRNCMGITAIEKDINGDEISKNEETIKIGIEYYCAECVREVLQKLGLFPLEFYDRP
jgi:hypothetical protein